MTLQASGLIDMSDLNVELSNSSTARIALGDLSVRNLLGVPSGRIALSDAYSKFAFTLPTGGTGGAWVATSDGGWGTFMNTYAIWNQVTTVPTVETFEAPIYIPVTGTYTIEYAVDTSIGFTFDSGYTTYNESQTTGAGASGSKVVTQYFVGGYHQLYITVANTGSAPPNPWGIAMTIKDPSNNVIWTTRNLNFQNGYFNTGTLSTVGTTATFGSAWTIQLTGTNLDGVDTILGFTTPHDTTFPWPCGPNGNGYTVMTGEKDIHNASLYSQIGNYSVAVSADIPSGMPSGTQSMRLSLGDVTPMIFSTGNGAGTTRGPYLVSNEFVTVAANKSVTFWYKALGIQDAFDVYAYVVDIYTGNTITILDASGQTATSGTSWTQVTTTIPTVGIYKFVFVCGSWDYTGGLYTGAALLITGISVQQ